MCRSIHWRNKMFNSISVGYLPQWLKTNRAWVFVRRVTLIKRESEKRCVLIQETLSEIYRKKIEEGWRIFYQDEVGFQTEVTLAYTWAFEYNRQRLLFTDGMVGLIWLAHLKLGIGLFYGVQTAFKVNAMRFCRFICHLKRHMRTDKILLICDNARFHKTKWLGLGLRHKKSGYSCPFCPPIRPILMLLNASGTGWKLNIRIIATGLRKCS